MSFWNRLPVDILSQIFEFVKDQDDARNPATNILPLLSVCKAWSNVAYKTAYHTIRYYGSQIYPNIKPTPKLLKAVENEMAGHNTRKIVIRTISEKRFKKVLLHFATYCPNVTSIDCPKHYEILWRALAVSSLYPKLTVLPHPNGEIGGLFNLCAWRYRKQLQKQYALAYHPSEPTDEVERLQYFPEIRHLVLLASNSGQIFYLDKIIDAYPQVTCLEFRTGLISKKGEGYPALPSKPTLYYPHENLDTLIVKFAYEHHFFEYLIHKFLNVKYGEISTTNCSKANMEYQDQYLCDNLNKLLAFTKKNSVTINLCVSPERLNEILGNMNVKNLELKFFGSSHSGDQNSSLTISKGNLQIHHQQQEFLRIWKLVSANIARLKIYDYSPAMEFDFFQKMFSYRNYLIDLSYKTRHRLYCPKEHKTTKKSCLKSLSFDMDDIQEDTYPFLSKIHPHLTRLSITLHDTKKQDVYRIDMSRLHLNHLDFYININRSKLIHKCLCSLTAYSKNVQKCLLESQNTVRRKEVSLYIHWN